MNLLCARFLLLAVAAALLPACGGGGSVGPAGPPGAPGSADAWSRIGNAGTVDGVNFLGSTDLAPIEIRVNDSRAARFEFRSSGHNVLLGSASNTLTAGVDGATVGGGGTSGEANTVTDHYGTVGGGKANRAGDGGGPTGLCSTVAGGSHNISGGLTTFVGGGFNNVATGNSAVISGGDNNAVTGSYSTVGGGGGNTVSESNATVGGGASNIASGLGATIAGGSNNQASGNSSMIPGGFANQAVGNSSFAAGRDARAMHDGAFVWADTTPFALLSTASNQFMCRAVGGYILYSNITATTGVSLAPGGGSWASLSDRALKDNFRPVDGREILRRVTDLPLHTWNYRSQPEAVRHIGPTSQDFAAAFGVGEDDRHITGVDADGVALAAIQGLGRILREQEREIAALKARVSELTAAENRWKSLEARLADLERRGQDR